MNPPCKSNKNNVFFRFLLLITNNGDFYFGLICVTSFINDPFALIYKIFITSSHGFVSRQKFYCDIVESFILVTTLLYFLQVFSGVKIGVITDAHILVAG